MSIPVGPLVESEVRLKRVHSHIGRVVCLEQVKVMCLSLLRSMIGSPRRFNGLEIFPRIAGVEVLLV